MTTDRIHAEADASGDLPEQPKAERQTVLSQPVRADAAEAQPERPHDLAIDAVGGEPVEPTMEAVDSPERDSGEPFESLRTQMPGSSPRGLRDPEREPDRDETASFADPADGNGSP